MRLLLFIKSIPVIQILDYLELACRNNAIPLQQLYQVIDAMHTHAVLFVNQHCRPNHRISALYSAVVKHNHSFTC